MLWRMTGNDKRTGAGWLQRGVFFSLQTVKNVTTGCGWWGSIRRRDERSPLRWEWVVLTGLAEGEVNPSSRCGIPVATGVGCADWASRVNERRERGENADYGKSTLQTKELAQCARLKTSTLVPLATCTKCVAPIIDPSYLHSCP